MKQSECLGVNQQGHLTIGGCDTVLLAKQYGTPLYVMDEEGIRAACRSYRSSIDRFYSGRGMVCYASKAFCCKEICRIVTEEGLDLDVVSGGELYIDGKLMNDIPPKDRDIAMVFQNYALYPHMTVYENMAFGLKLRHVDPQEIDRKVKEAAEILDITQYLDRKPKALSGGQRQRVAIGRAIVRSPKVFLMDEPLSNLDAKLRNQMRAEIIKLRQRIDTTFIYVTHDQTEAMTLGDRIVIMRDGEIQQVGTPQEVFDHPANLFVAGFIGMPRMNTFDAQLQRDPDGKFAVQLANAHVVLSDEKQARLAQKNVQPGPIVLGIRPEHIMLAGEGEQMIHGTVDVSEMMGSAVHLHLQACGRDTIIIVQTMSMQGATNSSFGIGQSIAFTFGGNVVHVFDPETGKNLEF